MRYRMARTEALPLPRAQPRKVAPLILTAQEEFGLRCALSMARAGQDPDGLPASVTLGQIAEAEGLTTAYAGKIMRMLVQGGLVESTRGRSGGYRLVRPGSEITVSQLIDALGGKFYDGEICHRSASGNGLCVHNNDCAVRSLWSGLQTMVDLFLARVTLRDLVVDEATMDRTVAVLRESLESESSLPLGRST